jgi:hypothetical protein
VSAPPSDLGAEIERLSSQLTEQHRKLEGALQRRTETQAGGLQRLATVIERHVRRVTNLEADVERVRALLRRYESYTDKLETLLSKQTRDRTKWLERLERLAAGTRPIIVGPWTGEVGYEVLYWVPFVRWFVERYNVDQRRLHVISRGGPVSWYDGIGSQYVDALSFFSPGDFRDRLGRRAWMKQDEISGLDLEILRRGRHAMGRTRAGLLHPLLMFRFFKPFWGGALALNEVLRQTSHRRIPPPQPLSELPSRYVAVRFYFRTSFPDTASNRTLVERTLSALTAHTDIVLLNPGFQIDDHHDYLAERGHRVHRIDHLLTPERNLEVQTAVIAHAQAFVGSYGGFSYLAPLFGVNSIAFYSAHTFKTCHLELAEHVFDRVGGGSLTVLGPGDVDLLTDLCAATGDR